MPDDSPKPPPPDDPGPPPGEDDLVAYLDGELDPDQARAVESRLALDPGARAATEALKKTYDLLDYLPRPEPSPDFTQRTLTRIDPPPAGTPTPSVPSLPGYAPPSPPAGRFRVAGWALAGLAALGAGYLARAVVPPAAPGESGALAFSDVRVIENLPLYLGVDDLDFLTMLDRDDLFPPHPGDADTARPPVADPVTAAERDRLEALFRSFPPARRHQLRQFDKGLHDLDPADRERLTGTLERYAVWLDRLPDPDRKEVLTAPSPAERLQAVRRVRERAWRGSLPAGHKARLDGVPSVEELDRRVAELRKQEADRRAAWDLARRQWDAVKTQAPPWPFSDARLADDVDRYAKDVLRPRLTPAEQQGFDRLRQGLLQDPAPEGKGLRWFQYGALLLELSERHPSFPEFGPGRKTVRTEADLPDEFVARMTTAGGRKVLQLPGAGKWPEYAEAVLKRAKDLNVPIKSPLGPSRPGEFTPAVNEFVGTTLKKAATRGEWDALRRLEGEWPEYPKRMIEIAAAHNLGVPGVTLPGPPKQWSKLYRPQRGN